MSPVQYSILPLGIPFWCYVRYPRCTFFDDTKGQSHFSALLLSTAFTVMVASTLVSVYKDSIRYAKLAEAAIQGCICVYVFLALLSWQSEKEKEQA